MRKSFVLTTLLLILIFTCNVNIAFTAGTYPDNPGGSESNKSYTVKLGEDGTYNYLKDKESVTVDDAGDVYMSNYDKIATSKVRYTTLGYVVKRARVANKNATDWVIVPVDDYDEIRNVPGDGMKYPDDTKVQEGYMLSTVVIKADILLEQIGLKYENWEQELRNEGGTVYLDGVMAVRVIGDDGKETISGSLTTKAAIGGSIYVPTGTTYDTAEGIKAAKNWADKSALNTHFNKEVVFPPLNTNTGSIKASLSVTASPSTVPTGVTTSVSITLDSSASTASLNGEVAAITSRRFWKGTMDESASGIVQPGDTATITVDNVSSGSVILCNVRVFSQALADADLPSTDVVMVPVYIGQLGTSQAKCSLKADERYSEKFDVLQGIPTSEKLYANVIAGKYIAEFETSAVSDTKAYNVTVSKTYNLSWEEDDGEYVDKKDKDGNVLKDEDGNAIQEWVSDWDDHSASETVTKDYTVYRDYKYHQINHLEVFGIDRAEIYNGCLPTGGAITLYPVGYTAPVVNKEDIGIHIDEPEYSDVTLTPSAIDGGSSKPTVPSPDWSSSAEAAVGQILVRNDRFILDGATIMDDGWYVTNTLDPAPLPDVPDIGRDVLYERGIKISNDIENGTYASTGDIYYNRIAEINGDATEQVKSLDINPVIVHTPVVCDTKVINDTSHDQEISPDSSKMAFVLGRPSQFTFPTIGKYINKKGYVNADYRKYTSARYVTFPFDVYIEGTFQPARDEYTMPVDTDVLNLRIPTWVEEGDYTTTSRGAIECRAVAVNADAVVGGENLKQELSNISNTNYVAVKSIPVRVMGRVFGFRVTDINDYPDWAEVFRTGSNSTGHSDTYFWVGTQDEEGADRGNDSKYTLPLMNGSHASKDNLGVLKTGYKIKFDLTTIGNYYGDTDCIRIRPQFYYVSRDGNIREPVDLWYTGKVDGKDSLVKIGSATDNRNIKTIVLGDPYRNVPESEISTTADLLGLAENTFKNQKAKIGSFGEIILSKPVRTFIGNISWSDPSEGPGDEPPLGVDDEAVKKSVQKWYGEYYVPNNVYACEKDLNVTAAMGAGGFTGKEAFWYRNGYIIVNFDIETIKDKEFPQLSYWNNPFCDMWNLEGFEYSKIDVASGAEFTLSDGDIIFYYTDKRSSDDYSTGGTN